MGTTTDGTPDNVHGEGNYEASRQYNRATKEFVESGRVEEAARDAAPRSPEEARAMREAEQAALLRAKHQPDGTVDDIMEDDAAQRGVPTRSSR